MDVFIGNQAKPVTPSVNVLGQWKLVEERYVKVNGMWKSDMEIQTYALTVKAFNAPGKWVGFNDTSAGSVSPNTHQGFAIRDMNSPEESMTGPLSFQLGIWTTTGLPRAVKYVSVGEHEKIPFDSLVNEGSLVRYFFSDGVTNLYEYLKARVDTVVTIKLWLETP